MIWAAVAWPLLAGAASVILFNRRVTIFEALALLIAPLGVIWALKWFGDAIVTNDVEYWTAPIAGATYNKAWTERKPCHHYKKTKHGRQKKHAFDKVKHKSSCYAEDTTGQKIKIPQWHFDELCRAFGNRNKLPLPARVMENVTWVSETTKWDGHDSDLVAATTTHRYVNRIPASKSEYTYHEGDIAEWRLYDYPEIKNDYEAPALLGFDDPEAARRLDVLNAKHGPTNQVRVMILVFVDKPREAGLAQEARWQGGNKNEFVICIGLDYKNAVQWSHVFSWTDSEDLKIEARNKVAEQKDRRLNLSPILDWLEGNIGRFKRKSFSDFDYLNVTPPLWYVLLAHIVVLFVTGLWFYLAVVKPDRE